MINLNKNINWGVVITDITIIICVTILVIYFNNYYLLWLFLMAGCTEHIDMRKNGFEK